MQTGVRKKHVRGDRVQTDTRPFRSGRVLTNTNVIFLGTDQWFSKVDLCVQHRDIVVQRAACLRSCVQACNALSVYDPTLVVVEGLGPDDLRLLRVLGCLQTQLFFRVVQVVCPEDNSLVSRSGWSRNPCLQLRSIVGDADFTNALESEMDLFFEDADLFSETISRAKKLYTLSVRETTVARYAGLGIPNKVICKRIGVSIKTVEKIRQSIYRKLGITTGAELGWLLSFRCFYQWASTVAIPE